MVSRRDDIRTKAERLVARDDVPRDAPAFSVTDVTYLLGLVDALELAVREYSLWGSCLCDPGHRVLCPTCRGRMILDAYRLEHG